MGSPSVPEVSVRRSDPIYNAHGYLTKVPVTAIIPFIQQYSSQGETVLDVFAGSGMSGVAAAITGRRSILVDISELGRHIGTNYLNFVEHGIVDAAAESAMQRADDSLGFPYATQCKRCGELGVLSRAVWSVVYQCEACSKPVVYFEAMRTAKAHGAPVKCPLCRESLEKRTARRIGERKIADVIACRCSKRLIEQDPRVLEDDFVIPEQLTYPDVPIEPDREMFRRSALKKHGYTSTARFFSRRNLGSLAALRLEISKVEDSDVRSKLLFVLTAILSRASKRYQWGPKRPLNAQNQTYYVAPIFLEWNVFDLFRRKLQAIKRSDNYIQERIGPLFLDQIDVRYVVRSAEDLTFLDNESVDYVFTDPPFGSNIFYSDMNLFHEAWLGGTTDRSREAVIPTNGDREAAANRYLDLLASALRECYRVLKPGRHLSLVFSNSSGIVWSLAQRAIHDAGFILQPEGVSLLDKGQRSVKGLSSGYEKVVTTDLVLTMEKPSSARRTDPSRAREPVEESVRAVLNEGQAILTPSRLYLRVVRRYLHGGWDLSGLDFGRVLEVAAEAGLRVNPRTGAFVQSSEENAG